MQVEFVPLSDFGLQAAAELFSRAFADYIVKIPFTQATLWHMVRVDSVSLADSRVALVDGQAVGLALIARRGWTSRVAAMGLLPEARCRGVGQAMVERLLTEARKRDVHRMILEVIEQNTPAVKLYERTGFARLRRLVGFAGAAPDVPAALPNPTEVDLRDVARHVTQNTDDDWPWQISGETVAQATSPDRGFELNGAWIAVHGLDGPQVVVQVLSVDGTVDQSGRAAALLQAVMALHPDKSWRIAAYWPEELADWFTEAGLPRQELTQWQMTCDL